ncbi:transcriptional regulator [Clostridia bacterium]|nr:transcriptional regulator [Clostridia bacterium]
MSVKKDYNRVLASKTISNLKSNGIESYYFESREEAIEKALTFVSDGCTVSCGGSLTLNETGLRELLKARPITFIDPKEGKSAVEMAELSRRALTCDCFFMSSNAITLSGELVNADGIGNRVAALCFGAKQVVVVAGVNKIVADIDAAYKRVEEYAAVLGQLDWKCGIDDYDEIVEGAKKSVKQLVITRGNVIPGRIKVILIGESLGF